MKIIQVSELHIIYKGEFYFEVTKKGEFYFSIYK